MAKLILGLEPSLFLTYINALLDRTESICKIFGYNIWLSFKLKVIFILTSVQKPKKVLEPFLRKISKCLILG